MASKKEASRKRAATARRVVVTMALLDDVRRDLHAIADVLTEPPYSPWYRSRKSMASMIRKQAELRKIVYNARTERDRLRAIEARAQEVHRSRVSVCPECGPNVKIDADGCCMTCGIDSLHPKRWLTRYILHGDPAGGEGEQDK